MSTDLDALLESADAPLIVVTTAAEGERAGCLVGFHSQASISPQRYCFWLSKANHTYRVALRSEHFAVHFLTRSEEHTSELQSRGHLVCRLLLEKNKTIIP